MQKNIHIDNIERTFAKTGNEKFVLISGKDKYQFFGTEKGEDSLAKRQFNELGVHPDMDIQVEYLEEPETFTGKDGNLVNWTKRSVRGIFLADGPAQPSMTPRQERFNNPLYDKPKEEPKDDKFWDMKAYKQCLWNYWLENKDGQKGLTDLEMQLVWEVFNQIEKDAKKRFFEFDKKPHPESVVPGSVPQFSGLVEELPTIQVQEDTKEWDKTFNCTVCGTQGATHGDGHDCLDF